MIILTIIGLALLYKVYRLYANIYPNEKLFKAFMEGKDSFPVRKLTGLWARHMFVPKHEYNKANQSRDIHMYQRGQSFFIRGTGVACFGGHMDLDFTIKTHWWGGVEVKGKGQGLNGHDPEQRAAYIAYGIWLSPWHMVTFTWCRPAPVDKIGVLMNIWRWKND